MGPKTRAEMVNPSMCVGHLSIQGETNRPRAELYSLQSNAGVDQHDAAVPLPLNRTEAQATMPFRLARDRPGLPQDPRRPSNVQIKVSARHGHLNDNHQEEIRQRAEKLLHYFDRISFIEVTVDLGDKIHKKVEILVDAEHKHDFVAQDEHEELIAAMDLTVDRIKHQIHRYKEKIQDRR
jgi:putative sigma-54 modulation protein